MIIPRSHATAFARLAYETAYLKAHHPAAFYAARLNAQPGGFYHPSVVVGDARRHGLAILGPHLGVSSYDCTLEAVGAGGDGGPGGPTHGVRLGLRYVRGLAEASGRALVAERERGGPFRDLADLCRRGRGLLTPDTIAALVAAGACDAWGAARRQLLWALPATWRAATGLPLPVRAVPLPAETPLERAANEGRATGLPLTAHPLATQRAALDRAGIRPIAALAEAREGTTVTIAGLPVVAQSPPTARGVVFLSLEDETGLANAILAPAVARAQRAALHAAPILLVTGTVQRRPPTVNVRVRHIGAWCPVATGADTVNSDED